MNSYDRVLDALAGKRIDRIPCVNSVGTYTRQFMELESAFWPEAHRDPEKMARLASAAHRRCGLDNITVPFDLVVEAEVLGAPINYFEGKIKWPSVRNFIVKDISDLRIPNDASCSGRVSLVMRAINSLKKTYENEAPIIAYINCPFTSISSYLVDTTDFLMRIKTDPQMIKAFYTMTMNTYAEIANVYREAGADVITFREEGCSTSNISPTHFEEFIKPNLRQLIGKVKPPRILHICGETSAIIPSMVECGAEAISIDHNTMMKEARELADKIKIDFPLVGNIDPTGIISKGPPNVIRDSVRRVINEGATLVAPGCDFWLETPLEHLKVFVDSTREFSESVFLK
jgi:MtaA/CmuA family methyltransferase